MAVKQHCKHSKLLKGSEARHLTTSPYGITIIPESDLYRLILRIRDGYSACRGLDEDEKLMLRPVQPVAGIASRNRKT